jgi:hypothetical protein
LPGKQSWHRAPAPAFAPNWNFVRSGEEGTSSAVDNSAKNCPKLTQRHKWRVERESKNRCPAVRASVFYNGSALSAAPLFAAGASTADKVCHETQVADVTKSGQTPVEIDQS